MNDRTSKKAIEEQLEILEQEIAERQETRRELLATLSGETVDDYAFTGPNGRIQLSELFGERDELLLIHNMGRQCSYCTLWADTFNGVTQHLQDRTAFVVVSPNSPEVQQEFAESRGWTFPMYSTEGSSFSRDMGFEIDHEGKPWQLPGVSVFRKNEDGSITRTIRDFFGPGDPYAGIWHLFSLLPEGSNGWNPKISYAPKA